MGCTTSPSGMCPARRYHTQNELSDLAPAGHRRLPFSLFADRLAAAAVAAAEKTTAGYRRLRRRIHLPAQRLQIAEPESARYG